MAMTPLLLYITLGAGTCDSSGDWCKRPVGNFAITQEIYKGASWWVDLQATHYSQIGGDEFRDAYGGRLGGDYGENIFLIRVNKIIFEWH